MISYKFGDLDCVCVFLSGFSLIRTLARYRSNGIKVIDAYVGCDVVMLLEKTPGLRYRPIMEKDAVGWAACGSVWTVVLQLVGLR